MIKYLQAHCRKHHLLLPIKWGNLPPIAPFWSTRKQSQRCHDEISATNLFNVSFRSPWQIGYMFSWDKMVPKVGYNQHSIIEGTSPEFRNAKVKSSLTGTTSLQPFSLKFKLNKKIAYVDEFPYQYSTRVKVSSSQESHHFLHPLIGCSSSSANRFRKIRTANTHFVHYNYDSLVPANRKPV